MTPADVDVVVNTHIHYDHVGWNTRRAGQGWIPAFPNVRYLANRDGFAVRDWASLPGI